MAYYRKFENILKKYFDINKGSFKFKLAIISPFTEDPILYPIFSVNDSFLCSIGKKKIFEKEFGNPIYSIKEEDIDKNNNSYSLISVLGDTCKSTLIFCKRCNKYSYEYYTSDLYQKTGEEQYMLII